MRFIEKITDVLFVKQTTCEPGKADVTRYYLLSFWCLLNKALYKIFKINVIPDRNNLEYFIGYDSEEGYRIFAFNKAKHKYAVNFWCGVTNDRINKHKLIGRFKGVG